MSNISCPKCGEPANRGSYAVWQIVVSICFFPLGLLCLLAGRGPSECPACNHHWT